VGIAIAVLIGLLLILLVIALLCKFEYKIKVTKPDKEAKWEYDARIRWLWGIIKRKIKSGDEILEKVKKEEAPDKVAEAAPGRPSQKNQKPKIKEKSRFTNRLKGLDIESALNIIGYTLGLLKKIFTTFMPKRIVVRGRYGTKNPAVTGKVLGAIYAAAAALSIRADVEGDFENEVLQLDIRAMGYFRLWVIFVPAVRYILRPEIWRLIFPKRSKEEKKEARKAKKEIKKATKEAKKNLNIKKNNLEVDENGNRIQQ
jgi:hypothetical protein